MAVSSERTAALASFPFIYTYDPGGGKSSIQPGELSDPSCTSHRKEPDDSRSKIGHATTRERCLIGLVAVVHVEGCDWAVVCMCMCEPRRKKKKVTSQEGL